MTSMTDVILLFLSAKYIHQKPSVRKLDGQIKKQGWTANHPTPEEIRQMWKPASKLSIEVDAHTYKKTIQQNWKGLVIQDFGGEKGLSKKTFHFSCKEINMNT